jgi:hypothetical protein
MESIASAPDKIIIEDQRDREGAYEFRSPVEVYENNPAFEKTPQEVSESFSDYIDYLQLGKDPNLMVLSSSHYYYEIEDMKEVRILVNTKQINEIKQTRDFLNTIKHVLPLRSYFIGCFFDNQNQSGFLSDPHKPQKHAAGQFDPAVNGISSRNPFLNMLYNFIDFRTNMYMSKGTVKTYLEDALLKVLDMTEIDGLTYFCSQKVMYT